MVKGHAIIGNMFLAWKYYAIWLSPGRGTGLDGWAETIEPARHQTDRTDYISHRTTSSNTLVNMVRSRVDLKGSRKGMHR